jgi:hypothetical protein
MNKGKTMSAVDLAIKKIKASGFWCQATETRIRKLAMKMSASGAPDELVGEVIVGMWDAVASEYGE